MVIEGVDGVDGGKGERRWTRVGDGCAGVVMDEVDVVDAVAGGDGREVVETAMMPIDGLGVLG